MTFKRFIIRNIELLIPGLIFLVLFTFPVLFTRIDGSISWSHVFKIWKDDLLLIPLFLINHFLFVPKILFKKNYLSYFICVTVLIFVFTSAYYYYDSVLKRNAGREEIIRKSKRPAPIPPYANLLTYSLMLVVVDTGLSFSRSWFEIEENRINLEKKNAEMQLEVLKHQISPHFFMNTLNNIYSLIDRSNVSAKESVMQLSKLMRYMLYENSSGRVMLSKEFEFVKSYIDLMKLRFTDDVQINLHFPENYSDISIPSLLFISYIENAFKYGASYQNNSLIEVIFELTDNKLLFKCTNTIHSAAANSDYLGGIGLKNSENRLKILYGRNYALSTLSVQDKFIVTLVIPIV